VGTLRTFALFQPTITLGQGLATMVVLGFGAMAVSRGEIPLGTLVAFFAYVQMLFQPMRELADRWIAFVSGMASAERVFSMLEWRDEEGRNGTLRLNPIPSVHGGHLKPIRGEIVFENVWFAYRDENWVLRDFNLTVRAGERIGVVGHTGAGKSTLIQLLLRFHEPRRGRILLDGRDLRDWDRRELRARIGLIQQEVFLFSGTVDENIRLWVGDPVRPEDVSDLGIDQELLGVKLEERGGNRSQGERQLLAFARARAARPSLWILDEATANVDSETEIRLERAFSEASRGCTVFMIAHRLSTVRSCDRILVLHRGELVEQGSHSELVALGGLYAHLHRAQLAAQAAVEAEGRGGDPVGVQTGNSPA
jgi:ATP-binding cassette subfamily B multidrug efflux pump